MNRPEFVIIAAVGVENRVIGKGLDLPWHIPADLKRFKSITSGHPIVMGHRTFDSLVTQFGGPLPNRRNIVLSQGASWPAFENVEVFATIDEALEAIGDVETVFIGGGAMVYETFLPLAHRMELTLVEGSHEGDVFFPAFEHLIGTDYEITNVEPHDGFRFVSYQRIDR